MLNSQDLHHASTHPVRDDVVARPPYAGKFGHTVCFRLDFQRKRLCPFGVISFDVLSHQVEAGLFQIPQLPVVTGAARIRTNRCKAGSQSRRLY
jgi:hypothetical protein